MKVSFSDSDINETKKLLREKRLDKFQVSLIGSIVVVFFFVFKAITEYNSTLSDGWYHWKMILVVLICLILFLFFINLKLIPLLLDLLFKKKVVVTTKLEYDTYDIENYSENVSPKKYVQFTNISSGMITTREAPYLLANNLRMNDKVKIEYAFFNGHILKINKVS